MWSRPHPMGPNALFISCVQTIYHIIRDGTTYEDLGSNYFDERERDQTIRRTVHRLERLGCKVTVEAA